MKTPKTILSTIVAALTLLCCVGAGGGADKITRDTITSSDGIVLTGSDRLSTIGTFQPPVEIAVVAKTDSTNIRLTYAADQIILNWEGNPEELRIDGGPANGLHRVGAGRIPTDKFVTIKWVVTERVQSIFVNDELRFRHEGDYSRVNRPVSIFPAFGSKVTVKSVKVKPIKPAAD